MGMFKPKKKDEVKPVEYKEEVVEYEDDESEEVEEEVEEEEAQEKPIKKKLSLKKKSAYNKGDIIPVQQTIGYQVVEDIDEHGMPLVVSTDKLSEAKILSFMYQQ